MAVEIVSPFHLALRRSAQKGEEILTGRWVAVNAQGQAVAPGAGAKTGLYLALEGSLLHTGSNTDFGASPFPSTSTSKLPAVEASGEVALAYGVLRYKVGPEGCDPAASYVVGNQVEIDAFGRLIPLAAGTAVGRVEGVVTDANGVTQLVVRTFGN